MRKLTRIKPVGLSPRRPIQMEAPVRNLLFSILILFSTGTLSDVVQSIYEGMSEEQKEALLVHYMRLDEARALDRLLQGILEKRKGAAFISEGVSAGFLSVTHRSGSGYSLIELSSLMGDAGAVKYLMDHHRGDVEDPDLVSAFDLACINGNSEALSLILNEFRVSWDPDRKGTARECLHLSVKRSRVDNLRVLLDKGLLDVLGVAGSDLLIVVAEARALHDKVEEMVLRAQGVRDPVLTE